NEELETSKEELQSLNEELNTVNTQLNEKVSELEVTNNDLANLFASAEVATLFLDRDCRIKRFTPPTTKLLSLIATDLGRPITDVYHKYQKDDLAECCKEVLRSLVRQEKEVRSHDGRWYLRRILPYRTLDNRIEGTVITFVDISQVKSASDHLRRLASVLV